MLFKEFVKLNEKVLTIRKSNLEEWWALDGLHDLPPACEWCGKESEIYYTLIELGVDPEFYEDSETGEKEEIKTKEETDVEEGYVPWSEIYYDPTAQHVCKECFLSVDNLIQRYLAQEAGIFPVYWDEDCIICLNCGKIEDMPISPDASIEYQHQAIDQFIIRHRPVCPGGA